MDMSWCMTFYGSSLSVMSFVIVVVFGDNFIHYAIECVGIPLLKIIVFLSGEDLQTVVRQRPQISRFEVKRVYLRLNIVTRIVNHLLNSLWRDSFIGTITSSTTLYLKVSGTKNAASVYRLDGYAGNQIVLLPDFQSGDFAVNLGWVERTTRGDVHGFVREIL